MAGLTLGEVLLKAILINPIIESRTIVITKLELKWELWGRIIWVSLCDLCQTTSLLSLRFPTCNTESKDSGMHPLRIS